MFTQFEKRLYSVSFNSYAEAYFAKSKGGMFSKKEKVGDMVQFLPKLLKHNLLASTKPESAGSVVALFGKVMVYMGDLKDKKFKPGTYLLLTEICKEAIEVSGRSFQESYRR